LKKVKQFFFGMGFALSVLISVWGTGKPAGPLRIEAASPDSDSLKYPFPDRYGDAYSTGEGQRSMYLKDPSNIKTDVQYDVENNRYNINENMGNLFYRNPSYMTFEEFVEKDFNNTTKEYWRQRSGEEDQLNKKAFAPKITINSAVFDRIFGGNTIDIRPQGSAELSFGVNVSNTENPSIPTQQRRVTTFDFREKIQMNIIANIGTKMKLTTNYNTEATFDFENKMKIEYSGDEDDIIKKIEAGNITMPLNSQLIQGSQSLFGIKTQLQFGKMMVTGLFSQQKGKPETINVQGGAQSTTFDIKADQYEDNKHFFLAQYFANTYDQTLRDLSHIATAVNITRIEVWVTTRGYITSQNNQNRNIFAFSDLGEYNPDPTQTFVTTNPASVPFPNDSANNLYPQLNANVAGGLSGLRRISNSTNIASSPQAAAGNFTHLKNYETVENARLLLPSEYTLNAQLGYISLNSKLRSNDVLAVAFEYTINGQIHRVGDLTGSSGVAGDSALFVKLIHSTNFSPRFYTWDLMMKNIYSLGGYGITPDKFRLDVLYQDDKIGGNINYIPAGCENIKNKPLLTVFNLDDLNTQQAPVPDGLFDFVTGITINPQAGRIIFPVREPFGSYLRSQFCNTPADQATANFYTYDALYDSTKTQAQQQPEKNKFSLRGSFQSSSGSEIPLNAVNVPQGSVKVTAGGKQLVENVDYTVDYTLGRVKIINDGILKSNTPITINLESQSLFSLQTKSVLGARLEYTFNKDFQVGGTVMHMYERPLTQKVNVGDEPISNTVWGTDVNYRHDSRFLTKLVDKLPFFSTKEISSYTLNGEVAQLVPGHSNAVGKAGISYIDDFEGAITPLDLKNPASWYLSSIPEQQTDAAMFPESASDSVTSGLNRAKMAWYYVDPIFQSQQPSTPDNVDEDQMSNNFVREVIQTEIFPNIQRYTPQNITCMNVAFYPNERGPYNYDVTPSAVSSGIDSAGNLKNPETRWGGIMRKIETNDFEANNIEFIQFWMLDPFAEGTLNDGSGGDLYFNIGTLSEDILHDQHKMYENGLPLPTGGSNNTAHTAWGVYPTVQSIVNAFDGRTENIVAQDVGLDGLGTDTERIYYSPFLNQIVNSFSGGTSTLAYASAANDPSTDNYLYFLDPAYDAPGISVLDRYKRWNAQEGNSVPSGSGLSIATAVPDGEDINRDNNMNTGETYYQYKVNLRPGNLVVGQNYITDEYSATVRLQNNNTTTVKWYQFKIPIRFPEKVIGDQELTNVEFVRMYMKNFQKPVICRFAKLEFLRGEWRRYQYSLLEPGVYTPVPEVPGSTTFDLSSVSIEENGARVPVPYVLPPGIEKERDPSAPALSTVNEQSLSLRFCQLEDGDARAAYKNTQFDIRSYKKLRLFIHAESGPSGETPLNNGELHAFMRLGSDFNDNYYEYEIPLAITTPYSTDPAAIWPESNEMVVDLQQLINAKLARNSSMQSGSAVTLQTPYVYYDGVHKITVKGTPNLSNLRSIMIGVRNPKDAGGSGAKLCGEVWFNELRLTDFVEDGGFASTARATAKLADLGTMALSGYRSTAGWGALEKKVSERDREDKLSYDFSTSVELGKFLPENSGVKVPFYFGYSEQKINPQYNPLDPDVKLDQALDAAPNPEAADKIRKTVTDYTERKSFNFTNVRKIKTGKNSKPHIYDVENLNFTYAYTEQFQRNYNIERDFRQTYQGAVGYNYNANVKPIAPFEKSKSKTLSSRWLKLIKDFNFNPIPTGISFRASLDRNYAETTLRNNNEFAAEIPLPTTYDKTYFMRRNYGLIWDLTKSLKLDYNADVHAMIDEPPGKIDTDQERDSVKENLRKLGRVDQYNHSTRLSYAVPLNKIPFTDWISSNVSYTGNYNWIAGPLYRDTLTDRITTNNPWGNTIQNSQTFQVGANFTLTSLYNKNKWLKKIATNAPQPPKPPRPVKPPTDSLNKAKPDSLKAKSNPLEPAFKVLAKALMMIKTASINYTETNGTLIPGWTPHPEWLGMDFSANGAPAPGWGFVFGDQSDIRPAAVRNGWFIRPGDSATAATFNSFYTTTRLRNLSLRATVEPIRSFKIELTGNRNETFSHSEYYKYNPLTDQFTSYSPTESGNFSISYLTWNTHFVTDADDYSNKNFQQFLKNREEYTRILDEKNPNAPRFPYQDSTGYGQTQKEVLTYSFLSAYRGSSPSSKNTTLFPKVPMPNWRITYDGLSRVKALQSIFQSISISHGYRSVYSVNSFTQNLLYTEDQFHNPTNTDTIGNFIPRIDLQQITISEQLSPLIGIDMTFKSSLQARFEIKRDRTLSLAYSNSQVTEVRGIEYTIGLGYKFKRVQLPFKIGTGKKLANDLTVKLDVNLRDNTTILRKVVEQTNQPSAGTKTLGLKFSADYPVSDRFNVRFFYDYNATDPFVSSSYPTSNTNAGISIRFTLAQ
jgi:cell surface protein SprA